MEDPRFYFQVAGALRGQIRNGEFKPGDPVPNINEIRRDTGFSRQTIGKALRMLEHEGLLTRVPGLGYHVADR
jgi:DNA-binding GntR family transcriptional regulator